jgi:hypothetical protein
MSRPSAGFCSCTSKSYEGVPNNTVYQHGSINQRNFIDALNARGRGQKAEYGDKQPEVNRALLEAWNWLQREEVLIRDPRQLVRDPRQSAPWFTISRRGEELLKDNARFEEFEKLGFDRVKATWKTPEGFETSAAR